MKKMLEYAKSSGLFYKKGLINFLLIRILNIFFPLITYKHVLNVVGVYNFGLFAASNSVIIFFAIFTNYGFELFGPIEISRNNIKDCSFLINKVSTQILFVKSILTVIAFLLVYPISLFGHFNFSLIIFSFQQIVFETLSLVFFFQGLNQLNILVYITLISKFISTLLCLLFIKDSNQIFLYPIFLGVGNAFSLAYSYYIAKKKFNFYFTRFSLKELIYFFRTSSIVFSGNLFGKVYQNGPRLFFSLFLSPVYSACYDVADKLINIISVPISIISDSILRNAGASSISFQSKNKSQIIIFIISVCLIIGVFFTSELLIQIFQNNDIQITKDILILLSLSALFSSLSNYLKIFHFINIGKLNFIAITVFIGMILFYLLGALLKFYESYSYYNGVAVFLLIEMLIFLSFFCQYIIDYFLERKL